MINCFIIKGQFSQFPLHILFIPFASLAKCFETVLPQQQILLSNICTTNPYFWLHFKAELDIWGKGVHVPFTVPLSNTKSITWEGDQHLPLLPHPTSMCLAALKFSPYPAHFLITTAIWSIMPPPKLDIAKAFVKKVVFLSHGRLPLWRLPLWKATYMDKR